jgi:glucose/arabinose dehydrogenase
MRFTFCVLFVLIAACGDDSTLPILDSSLPEDDAGSSDGSVEPVDAASLVPDDAGNDAPDSGPSCDDRVAPSLSTERIGDFDQPVFVTAAPDDPERLYVLEKAGRILVVEDGETQETPFLVIPGLEASGEHGLLGLAFHPDYATNGRFFVYDTPAAPRRNVVDEYRRSDNPLVANPTMVRRLVDVTDRGQYDNGGMIAFGPDGYLYVGMGDEGGQADSYDNALNTSTLFGSILHLDVDNAAGDFAAPGGPFAEAGGLPQVWAMGLRNPWRFSFDRENGNLFIGEVGQAVWEEVDVIEPTQAGANLGWAAYEGLEELRTERLDRVPDHHEPVLAYQHNDFESESIRGGIAISGGYVYRGGAIPELDGFYLFGDYGSRDVSAFVYCDGEATSVQRIPSLEFIDAGLVSFGEDGSGELYMVFVSGAIYRIVAGT